MSLHIALNATSIAPGGGLTGILGYLNAWIEHGFPFRLTAFVSNGASISALKALAGPVSILPFAVDKTAFPRTVHSYLGLARAIEKIGADVVWSTNFVVPRCRCPQLVHHRNLKHFEAPGRISIRSRLSVREAARSYLARRAVRLAETNVFVSDYLRRAAVAVSEEAAARSYVVYNGFERDARDCVAVFGDREARCVGRLVSVTSDSPHKDNVTLIRMVADLRRILPDVRWSLIIAGAGLWVAERHEARRLGVEENVTFTGFLNRREISELYASADLAVFSSPFESFGNGLVEAMAHGVPVVAAAATAMPEVVGLSGLLARPYDPSSFANAVVRLVNNRDFYKEKQSEGLVRSTHFSWKRSADRMAELLISTAKAAR